VNLRVRATDGDQPLDSAGSDPDVAASVVWLGQAGFVLRLAPNASGVDGYTLVIDPYLSDSLATKYAGKHFAHHRLIPPPARASELSNVDLVLCSHKHTDHMDPETLRDLAAASPGCRFIVPDAWCEHAADLGLPAERIVGAHTGQAIEPLPRLRVTPVLAAHEQLDFDHLGRSHHLGFVIENGDVRIYHSGDCVPYAGQAASLKQLGIQVALLPVNGRDAYRLEHGVPGNFHPHEAVQLANEIGADILIGHHFGMFEFNTVNENDLQAALQDLHESVQWLRPEPARRFELLRT
jgi:L-ascorbate metabolism protein UlaG (beta-lactamase superfamily)